MFVVAPIKPFNLRLMRMKNQKYNNQWMFPVRMENSLGIEWVDDIVCALSKFKKPITETTWRQVLDRGILAAETPEENQMLRDWWYSGWDQLPLLKPRAGTPICEINKGPMGDTLSLVYPTIRSFNEIHHLSERDGFIYLTGTYADKRYLPLREMHYTKVEMSNEPVWTLFTPDNKVVRHFVTKKEMADYLQCNRKQVDVVIESWDHRFLSGYWIWKDDWGLTPIAPNGSLLPSNWRQNTLEDTE